MKNLLNAISEANFHLLSETNSDTALQNCITALGSNISVNRCYVFQNVPLGTKLSLKYRNEWCSPNSLPFLGSPDLEGLTYDAFPGLYEPLAENSPLFGLVKESKNPHFKAVMELQKVKSYLFTPIFSNHLFWGWIGFDDCENERLWTFEEVKALSIVALNIGLKLNQEKIKAELEHTLGELDFYMKSSKQSKWELDLITEDVKFTYNWFGMLGYDNDELPQHFQTWQSLIHVEDKDRVEEQLDHYIKGVVDSFQGISRLRHKKGTYVWIKYSGLKVTNAAGIPLKIIGTHIDISEIKEKELEIKRQRNHYDQLVNNLAEIIFETDANGTITFLNKQWERVTGYQSADCLQKNIFDYFALSAKVTAKQIVSTNNTKPIEVELLKKDGTKVWVLLILSIQSNGFNGEKIIIGSATDIDDIKKLKNDLEISDKKYRFITENTSDLITQHQPDGVVTYISNNCQKILGYEPAFLLGKSSFDLVYPDDLELVLSHQSQILNGQKDIAVFRVRNSAGAYVWFEMSSNGILDANNDIVGIQSSCRDITERIREQENSHNAWLKEVELNQLKSNFVTMASHQFRTPLSIIYLNVELLSYKLEHLDHNKKAEIERISARIFNEAKRMTELMNNILIVGTHESNYLKVALTEFNTTTFFENIIENYFSNEEDGRKIILQTKPYLGTVQLDENLLTHIITNLLSNALKYSVGAQNPEITLSYGADRFKIQITDYGIGIPKADVKHLFKSFFRASNTTSHKGTGLGLNIAKKFTELMQGTISISSKEHKKTNVTLEFPYKQTVPMQPTL